MSGDCRGRHHLARRGADTQAPSVISSTPVMALRVCAFDTLSSRGKALIDSDAETAVP